MQPVSLPLVQYNSRKVMHVSLKENVTFRSIRIFIFLFLSCLTTHSSGKTDIVTVPNMRQSSTIPPLRSAAQRISGKLQTAHSSSYILTVFQADIRQTGGHFTPTAFHLEIMHCLCFKIPNFESSDKYEKMSTMKTKASFKYC